MRRVLVLSEEDNVAVALEDLAQGETAGWGGGTVVACDEIPAAHKLALAPIAEGAQVVKYGTPIGIATAAIPEGAHVHTHNVESDRMRGDR